MSKGKVLKSKKTSNGLIEICESGVLGWYVLYINGKIKEHSADLSFIQREYDRY